MKISVLVPIYGVEKYIERCAVSLFEQTYGDVEYVFVDDCSPDRSVDILQATAARYPRRSGQIKIVRNAANQGIGAVRQTLVDNSTGDCITFVDSDDYISTNALELMCAEMERSGADIVDGAWRRVSAGGVSDAFMPCRERDTRRYLNLILCQNIVTNRMWGRLYRRSLYTGGIRMAQGIDYSEDYSVIARLMLKARRSYINDTVYFYSEENTSSYTHSMSPAHVRSYIKANRIVLDFFKANDPSGRYSVPLQFGLINVLRVARANGFDINEADTMLSYTPRGPLFSLLASLFRGRCPYKAAEAAYLAARRMYLAFKGYGRGSLTYG